MENRPHLLYVSPVVPALTGNGLAMRAGMVLEALSARFSISLLVLKLYSGLEEIPRELAGLCSRTTITSAGDGMRSASGLMTRWLGPTAYYRRSSFEVFHVFRLSTMALARPLLLSQRKRPSVHLDLDDIESTTHARLARLCRAKGDLSRALFEESEARRCKALEEEALGQVDRVYVCSLEDKHQIESFNRSIVSVLPNGVRFPDSVKPRSSAQGFRFLFLGTLGYLPNEDAAIYLCQEIVPQIRELSVRGVGFDLVGAGASGELRKVAGEAGVNIVGPVPAVSPYYESAGAVVVPLRAGGGTRIKILEAFSYRRPVVSTSIGAEGIGARHEREILIADSPEGLADACLRLMANPTLCRRLVENALKLARRRYSLDAMRRALPG